MSGMSVPFYPTDGMCTMAVFRGFFDGRGTSKESKSSLVVLSGLVANTDVWKPFESQWISDVNSLLEGLPLSVTDCLSVHGGKLHTIPRNKRLKALTNAVACLYKWTRKGVDGSSITIVMHDYKNVNDNCLSLNKPEEICVDDMLSSMVFSKPDDKFEFFFDQGEGFLKHAHKYWKENPTKRATGPYYLRNVDILTSAPSTRIPIQCADVYTWVAYTFVEMYHLGIKSKRIPSELTGLLADPPSTKLWRESDLMFSPQAHKGNRILASKTRLPKWIRLKDLTTE
jgi:hypothetical protein